MNYISLFSGIEAASCAWEDLNLSPILFSEIDPYPASVLKYHYPSIPNVGDITKVDWSKYSNKIDLIVGGSPCQSFSYAGKREGLNGESRLMFEYIRAIQEVRSKWLIWENVPGVLSSGKGNDFRFLLNSFAELGYSLAWRILDSKYFGVPQQRRRVFVVGCLGKEGSGPAEVLFECESLLGNTQAGGKVRETAAGADEEDFTSSSYILNVRGDTHGKGGCGALIHRDISPALACSRQPTLFCRASTVAKAECYENLSPTLTAHNGVVAPFISFNPPRHLMPIECERIQGFPDNWTNVPGPNGKLLSNTRRYKMIGNSMAVPVMRWIGKRVLMVENNANSKAKM